MDGTGTDGTAADGTENAEAEVRAVSAAWAAAVVANDAEAIRRFTAEEWVMVSGTGVAPGERFLALVASGALTHSAMELVGEPRVRVHGDTALVTGRVTNTAHYAGERHDADEWTTDVFVRRDGRWRCVLTHLTPVAGD
ncbi:nuclear transport factor 2 family protein [Streptomyces sp. GSL17-111]|uniref:nuclear transport factor 2 family protein n=1 Tax=Streptomyces sp. GSL17-111 TaxID=3121596 RepID=UPI0030F44E2C